MYKYKHLYKNYMSDKSNYVGNFYKEKSIYNTDSIMNIDISKLAELAQKAYDKKENYMPEIPYNFLEHSIPILGSIPLVWKDGLVSSTETIKNMSNEISTPNGIYKNPKDLVRFLYYVKRSNLINGSQIKFSRLASFTPLLMYAQRLHNGVQYSKWDKNDKAISYILGQYLENLLTVKEIPENFDVVEYRKKALMVVSTKSKTYGELAKLTSYKCNLNSISNITLPKTAIMMILQLWLANSEVRDETSMILDPINWDNIPKPIDVKVVKDTSIWL